MLSRDLRTIAGALQAGLDAPNADLRGVLTVGIAMVTAAAERAHLLEVAEHRRREKIAFAPQPRRLGKSWARRFLHLFGGIS